MAPGDRRSRIGTAPDRPRKKTVLYTETCTWQAPGYATPIDGPFHPRETLLSNSSGNLDRKLKSLDVSKYHRVCVCVSSEAICTSRVYLRACIWVFAGVKEEGNRQRNGKYGNIVRDSADGSPSCQVCTMPRCSWRNIHAQSNVGNVCVNIMYVKYLSFIVVKQGCHHYIRIWKPIWKPILCFLYEEFFIASIYICILQLI